MYRRCLPVVVGLAVLSLMSCSPTPKPADEETAAKKEPEAPPAPVTAKTAFWPMYESARKSWSKDFVTLKLVPKEVPGFKNEGGKAAMWEATFASPSLHEWRTYDYAIAAAPPDIYKGVVVGRPMPWGGVTRDAMPIQLSDFNADSDAAYQAASTDAEAWLKKNPEKKLTTFELWNAYKYEGPVWFLMWGDKKAGYAAIVNASDGKVQKHK